MSLVSPVTQLWKLHKPDHLLIDFNRLLKYRWESLTQNSVNKMNEKQIKPTCFPFPRPSLKCRLALHNKYIFPFLFLFHFQQVYIYTTILSPTWTAQKPLHFLVRDWLPPAPNAFKQFLINYRPYIYDGGYCLSFGWEKQRDCRARYARICSSGTGHRVTIANALCVYVYKNLNFKAARRRMWKTVVQYRYCASSEGDVCILVQHLTTACVDAPCTTLTAAPSSVHFCWLKNIPLSCVCVIFE